jgi:hypothetical protein
MSFIKADRNQTNVPADVLIKRDAGITGLTVVLRILNGDDLDESVDFNDGVFKTAGHTTPTTACPAIDATNDPGLYGLSGGFDLTSITIPAGVNTLRFHYTITAGGEVGDSYDVIELDDRLVDLVWDEINRGADHNIKDSTGKQQRQASGGVDTGDVVAAGASTVTLAAGESAIDDFYTHRHIAIVDGLGAGQLRVIDSYVGATKVATVAHAARAHHTPRRLRRYAWCRLVADGHRLRCCRGCHGAHSRCGRRHLGRAPVGAHHARHVRLLPGRRRLGHHGHRRLDQRRARADPQRARCGRHQDRGDGRAVAGHAGRGLQHCDRFT